MKKSPLISIIVPTRNSSKYIEECLKSLVDQTYKNLEIIVVDNNSTDVTKDIARKFTPKVFNKGPERSQQRNYGAKIAKGKYILFIDSDMQLDKRVIEDGVDKLEKDLKIGGLIIPERSIGEGYFGKCKALEKGFYENVSWAEAARIFRKIDFDRVKGFDTRLISGEDWDLSHRVSRVAKIDRVNYFVTHNEGNVSLVQILRKKYYYSKNFSRYVNKSNENSNSMIVERYKLFLSKPKKLFKKPILGIGLLFIKTCEFGVGSIGYLIGKLSG